MSHGLSSTMADAVGNAQLTESLMSIHGTAHEEEAEATSNVEEIKTIDENIVAMVKDQQQRRQQLNQTTTVAHDKGTKGTADNTQKMKQCTTSYHVQLKSNEDTLHSLQSLAEQTTTMIDDVFEMNDAAEQFSTAEDLLNQLKAHKRNIAIEKQRHATFQIDSKGMAQSLEETKITIGAVRKHHGSTTIEMNNLQIKVDQDTNTLKNHQDDFALLQNKTNALVETHRQSSASYDEKERAMQMDESKTKETMLQLQNDIATNTHQLNLYQHELTQMNEQIAQLSNLLQTHHTNMQEVQQIEVNHQNKWQDANKNTQRLIHQLKMNHNIEIISKKGQQMILSSSPSESESSSPGSPGSDASPLAPSPEGSSGGAASPTSSYGTKEPTPFKRMTTSSMTVVQLRQALKTRGQDSKGKKAVLLKRLNALLDADEQHYLVELQKFNDAKKIYYTTPSSPTAVLNINNDVGHYASQCENRISTLKQNIAANESQWNAMNGNASTSATAAATGSSSSSSSSSSSGGSGPTTVVEMDNEIDQQHMVWSNNQQNLEVLGKVKHETTTNESIDSIRILLNEVVPHPKDLLFVEDIRRLLDESLVEDNNSKEWSSKIEAAIEDKKKNINERMLVLKRDTEQTEHGLESKFEECKAERNSVRTSLDLVEIELANEENRLNPSKPQ